MIADRIGAALRGRAWWMKLKREFDIDNGVYVLLMPEDDRELNEQALRHIDDLAAHRQARGVMIVTNQRWVRDNAQGRADKLLCVVNAADNEIDDLLSIYELYNFSERILVVSLTRPFGRKLYNAAGIHGVTKEDLVCLSIFMMRSWASSEAAHG